MVLRQLQKGMLQGTLGGVPLHLLNYDVLPVFHPQQLVSKLKASQYPSGLYCTCGTCIYRHNPCPFLVGSGFKHLFIKQKRYNLMLVSCLEEKHQKNMSMCFVRCVGKKNAVEGLQ